MFLVFTYLKFVNKMFVMMQLVMLKINFLRHIKGTVNVILIM